MADTTATQPTEANMPEKPAPAQFHTAPNHHYSAQPQQFQPVDLPQAEPFRPSKPFSIGKLTVATFNFVFAVIVLGLSIGILNIALYDIIGVLIAGVMAAISLLWQIAEYLTLAIRRSIHRPIHPGAHVGVHLVLWILALIVTLFCCFTLSYALTEFTVDSRCGTNSSGYYTTSSSSSSSSSGRKYVYCDFYNFTSDAQAHLYLALLEALTAFSVLMLVCHFALFVMACIETDQRRKYGKKARVVYLVAATAPADGRLYYSQVPPPPVQQQQQRAAPNDEVYGYFAPPAPAPADGAGVPSGPAAERRQVQEGGAGPSSGSYA